MVSIDICADLEIVELLAWAKAARRMRRPGLSMLKGVAYVSSTRIGTLLRADRFCNYLQVNAPTPHGVCSSKVLNVLRLVPQEVAAFGKVAATTPRQSREPTFRLLRSDNDLVQFGCLPFR